MLFDLTDLCRPFIAFHLRLSYNSAFFDIIQVKYGIFHPANFPMLKFLPKQNLLFSAKYDPVNINAFLSIFTLS